MEYQKITNLLDNTSNLPTKFRAKKWIGVNDGSYGVYITLVSKLYLKRQC